MGLVIVSSIWLGISATLTAFNARNGQLGLCIAGIVLSFANASIIALSVWIFP